MMQKNEELAPLPGVWRTIAAGFDLTTKHLWLLILPILLDLFLWLGPRLSSRPIIEQLIGMLPAEAAMEEMTAQLLELAPRTNLFTSLSVPVIGVPVFMVGTTPETTPIPTQVIELANPLGWLGLFLLFSVIGVGITAVYYTLIAQTIRLEGNQRSLPVFSLLGRMTTTWLQLIALGIVIAIAAFILYIPLMLVSFVAALLSQTLATLILLIGPVFIIWMLVFTYFVPHDLSLLGHPIHIAVQNSIKLVRTYFSPVLALLIIILIIRNILGSLLVLADDGSWLTGIGIVGHAFIMTSLMSATFIFFRDRYAILTEKHQVIGQMES